ncbi:hypothetical protein [Vibrio sp. VB16]|uniref:hypothetical protein n=1 Tax=Vibrio sp. VB16 TaxID=2785746 RepID=UPI00189C5A68|nr:hypothetical protein [Vibrio sp. VB16]UGA55304.1 hypothetical protein IUZ65_002830 [Vibrio sp. VB16]
MDTPLHSINMDFSHSSEAKKFYEVINKNLNSLPESKPLSDEFVFWFNMREQAIDAIELMESVED